MEYKLYCIEYIIHYSDGAYFVEHAMFSKKPDDKDALDFLNNIGINTEDYDDGDADVFISEIDIEKLEKITL